MYRYFDEGGTGNPCIVASTGAGKTVIIAKMIEEILQQNGKARILVLTHRKELIEQDAKETEDMVGTPVAVYSASCKRKEVGQVTFAGIQSIARNPEPFLGTNVAIVDEAHLISHNQTGQYRTFLAQLKEANPRFATIGLTATPYRLGHGRIDEGDALFDRLIETPSADVAQLIHDGYLSPLKAKATEARISTDGLAIDSSTHDFNKRQMQERAMDRGTSEAVVDEVLRMAGDRKAWIFFCTGIKHAQQVADILQQRNIPTACVTSESTDRSEVIGMFKRGEIRAVTNVDVLSTGFNYPAIDLVVLMRPTMSAGLMVQQIGRGLRKAPGKQDCLVLDFVGNIAKHGPINHITPPKGNMRVRNLTKTCPECGELVLSNSKVCTSCGYVWESLPPSKTCPGCDSIIPSSARVCPYCGKLLGTDDFRLHEDEIVQVGNAWVKRMAVSRWRWHETTSKAGNRMLMVTYFENRFGGGRQVREFFVLDGSAWAVTKAKERLQSLLLQRSMPYTESEEDMNRMLPPKAIWYETTTGSPDYPKIIRRIYE